VITLRTNLKSFYNIYPDAMFHKRLKNVLDDIFFSVYNYISFNMDLTIIIKYKFSFSNKFSAVHLM